MWLGFDPEIASIRPYQGLGELWRMVERSAFDQLGYRFDLLVATLVGLTLYVVAPLVVVAEVARFLAAGFLTPSLTRAGLFALMAWGLQALALLPAVRHHRVPARWAWALPFAGILYGAMTASSAWAHLRGRTGAWKGRTYGDG